MSITPEQRADLEHLIRSRLKDLVTEIQSDVVRSRDETYGELSGGAPDIGDESVADLLSDLANADTTRDLNEMRELEAALARIGQAGYGACIDCGDEIDYERLVAYPASLRCFRCQTVHEKTFAPPPAPSL